jgi:cytochrome P450
MGLAEWNLGLMPYGNKWRDVRKLFSNYLGPRQSRMLQPKMALHACILMRRLLANPEDFFEHLHM